MLEALASFAAIACAAGALLGWAARRWRREDDPLADAIERVLPQTQCAQCGFAGCRPYAEAIARGEAEIDRCPPGGENGVRALAQLLGREVRPLDPTRGATKAPQVLRVIEALCIGCTKCIQACPVDAIVGAPKLMHSVIESECTGCELCVPPCPVDCFEIVPTAAPRAAARSIPLALAGAS